MFLDKLKGKGLLWIPVILLVIIIIVLIVKHHNPKAQVISGEVDARQIDVSSKLAGRIDSLFVHEGQSVQRGEAIARMISPEMQAKYDQAVSAVASAKAMYDMALSGARKQDIQSANELYTAAKAKYDFTQKTYLRMQSLLTKKTITQQSFDEAQAKLDGAKAEMEAARAQWEKAKQGARIEEIAAAKGNYDRANNAMAEVRSYLNETIITAPIAGEIDNTIIDPGEMVAAGYPVVSIIDLRDIWVSVYVPETKLKDFTMGSIHPVDIPALGLKAIPCKVTYISVMADFATKKATNDNGSFDLKSFELHLVPTSPVNNLRPGMSAQINLLVK
jgi:HlyD family secretion protein